MRRGTEKRQSWCRACFAAANAANYAANREREKARLIGQLQQRRDDVRRRVIAYLDAHSCVDCGERDIVVLEFDHLGGKIADVSRLAMGGNSWPRVKAEIDKCEVRCANCHRKKTAERRRGDAGLDPMRAHVPRATPAQLRLDIDGALRVCRVCGISKSLVDFPFRSVARGTRHRICRECQRLTTRLWYWRNRRRHISRVYLNTKMARRAARHFVREYLRSHECVDCGESDVRALEFDHVRGKTAEISVLVSVGAPIAAIAAEIRLCDVRCANCHRRRTVTMNGGYRSRAR